MSTMRSYLAGRGVKIPAVRRWVPAGVASACVAAALVSWSLTGAGVAGADSGSSTSSSTVSASAVPVKVAGKGDNLRAIGRLFTSTANEIINRKTTLNPVQRLDDTSPKHKSLLELIFPSSLRANVPKRNDEAAKAEAARRHRSDSDARQIQEILKKGVKLDARDGLAVYTIDGKTFVKYTNVFAGQAPQPQLVTRNDDKYIRQSLRVDPEQVRKLRK